MDDPVLRALRRRRVVKLTAIAIKNAKPQEVEGVIKDRKLSDGRGLYLLVKKDGRKYWRQAYRYLGKQKTLALGVYPQVSLQEARERCNQAHKLLDQGQDPNEVKKAEKAGRHLAAANTFEALANEWYEKQLSTWAPATAKKAPIITRQ